MTVGPFSWVRTTAMLWLMLQESSASFVEEDSVKASIRFDELRTMDYVFTACVLLMAFELLDYISKHSGDWMGAATIPVRGKHLDILPPKHLFFIGLSKASVAPFVYFYLRVCHATPNIVWSLNQFTVSNTLLWLVPAFIVYDFFYTLLHWFLHMQFIYPHIHKHHHIQKAPSRANVDAINVHPIEFFLGEYNHLWTLYLVSRFIQVHVVGAILFLAVGGWLAGLNHTRHDIHWGVGKLTIFDSKAHDVHHRIPQSNYGQYIMLWDYLFGSYRSYNPDDRVNPDAQLDPQTGQTKTKL